MNYLDSVKNFALAIVDGVYTSTDLTINLVAGHGIKFPNPATDEAFNAVWWNSGSYGDPSLDPNAEIVRVTARSTDTLTILRAQEGTNATNKNIPNTNYSLLLGITKKMIEDIDTTLFAKISTSYLDTDVTLSANSDTKLATQKAVKTYADGLVAGLLDYRGVYDASSNLYPATGGSGVGGAITKGDMWLISVAGTLGGVAIQIGDSIIANTDSPGQTAGNWNALNTNISYTPENITNKVTSISGSSTDVQYPSAKLLYDQLALKANLISPSFTTPALGVATATSLAINGATLGSNALAVTGTSYFGNDVKIVGTNKIAGTYFAGGNLDIYTTDAMGANIGGVINLGGVRTGTTQSGFGSIAGKKENATDNNYSGYLSFYTTLDGTGSVERMRITSTGNVGIGVTPLYKLHVSGQIYGAYGLSPSNILTSYATTSEIPILTYVNGAAGGGLGTDAQGTTYISSYFGTALRSQQGFIYLAADGKAHIGNSSAGTALLNVYGEIRAHGGDPAYYAFMKGSAAENNAFAIGISGHNLITSYNDYYFGGTLQLWTSDTPRITILSDGKVGIKTTNPLRDLVISNSGAEGIELQAGESAGVNKTVHYNRVSSEYVANQMFASYHTFAIEATEAMRIASTGNIGIGTASPLGAVHIAGVNPVLILQSTNAEIDNKIFYLQNANGRFDISKANDAFSSFTQLVSVLNNGSLLVGYTADPTSGNKLAVNGNIYGSGSLTIGDVIQSTGGMKLYRDSGTSDMLVYSPVAGDILRLARATGNATFAGNILASVNNTLDIGASATKFRTGYFGTSVQTASLNLTGIQTISTSTYTVLATDSLIKCNCASNAITLTLPAAASNTGKLLVIKKTDSSANTVTIDGNASELIDDQLTLVMTDQYDSYTLYCDGSAWHII